MSDNRQIDIYEYAAMGEQNKKVGMLLSTAHADDCIDKWSERAFAWIKLFLDQQSCDKTFMAEEIREYAHTHGLDKPPNFRAWGSVIKRAATSNLIIFVGYSKTVNPNAHRACAMVWKKSVADYT